MDGQLISLGVSLNWSGPDQLGRKKALYTSINGYQVLLLIDHNLRQPSSEGTVY